MMEEIRYKPVGYVRTCVPDEVVKKLWDKGLISVIELLPKYTEGLEGLEGFSHIIVLYHLHKVTHDQRNTLKVRPRRLIRYGLRPEELPLIGVFATDSPHRPNPLALSIVEVLQIKGNRIVVRGLDAYDGSPVVDIKPYTPNRRVEIKSLPEWYLKLERRLREIRVNQK